jgi:hypothetical protein
MAKVMYYSPYSISGSGKFEEWVGPASGWITSCSLSESFSSGSMDSPTTTNQIGITKIFSFTDALQTTSPVHLKFAFGAGSNAYVPRLFFSVGTQFSSSNGEWNSPRSSSVSNLPSAATSHDLTLRHTILSGDGSRFIMAFWLSLVNAFYVSVERTKNSDGTDNGDGIIVSTGYSTFHWHEVIWFDGATSPRDTGLTYLLPEGDAALFGGKTPVIFPNVIAGGPQPYGTNIAIVNSAAVLDDWEYTLYPYGQPIKYYNVGSNIRSPSADVSSRLLLRYE